jgi:hypothetical protein
MVFFDVRSDSLCVRDVSMMSKISDREDVFSKSEPQILKIFSRQKNMSVIKSPSLP